MTSVEISEKVYNELKNFSEFLKLPLKSIVEHFLEQDIEWVKNNPQQILDHFLSSNEIIELIFGSE